MNFYNINFIIAIGIATLASSCFCNTIRKKILAILVVPTIQYIFFYNYDYGLLKGISPILTAYAGSVVSCLFFFIILSSSTPSTPYKTVNTSFLKTLSLFIFQFIELTIFLAIPWALDTFPFSNTEAVLFTLFAGTNEGAEEFVISSFIKKVLCPSIISFFAIILIQLICAIILYKLKITISFNFHCFKFNICGKWKHYLLQLEKILCLSMLCICLCHLLLFPGIALSAPFQALFQKPVDSELYRTFYVHPDSVNISSPTNSSKNLIVIFLESMATNFAQYTPEIAIEEKQSTSFPPGGKNVAGTSWTIAGITGKLCGIPLNMPLGIKEYHGKLPTYLPFAKCLMDILDERGYNQIYAQGSSGDFTQKRTFWSVHGNVAVHDIEYYKDTGKLPKNYNVFWGFEDRKLYKYVKEEIDSLAKLNRPFAYYMLTVDTHQPEGYLDDSCTTEIPEGEGQFPRTLRCASKQLASFLNWAKQQSWYKNTTISVMGDHTQQMLSDKANIPPTDSLYWVNFILNSSILMSSSNRQYSSFDMFPTLLESMGFKLEGRAIGLGQSLYAGDSTILERYGQVVLDSLLRERSIQYDLLLLGK